MWQQGYVQLLRVRGIPLRVHWSIALGMLWVSGPHFVPGAWLALALLILVHELGHAYLARRYRLQVHSIDMDALGGACVHEAPRVAYHDHVIAWGGVLAQALLLGLTLGLSALDAWPAGGFFASMRHVFIDTNLFIMAFNLLPFPPLDGASAWKLFRRTRLRRRPPTQKLPLSPLRPPQRARDSKPPREVTDDERAQIDRTLEEAFDEAKRKR